MCLQFSVMDLRYSTGSIHAEVMGVSVGHKPDM